MKFSIKYPLDLVTFIEGILYGKLHFFSVRVEEMIHYNVLARSNTIMFLDYKK